MRFLFGLAALAVPAVLSGQTEQQLRAAAEAISAQEIAHHIGVIADDSMMGRDTPSPGLEKTARYVADQFKKAGLRPAGDGNGWFQRYWILPQLDFTHSQVTFAAHGKRAVASFATAARLVGQHGPARSTPASVVLVADRHTSKSVADADLRNKIVLYVPPAPGPWDADNRQDIAEQIGEESAGLLVLSADDSVEFTRRLRLAQQNANVSPSAWWVIAVRPDAVPGLGDVLTAAGVDLSRVRSDTTPVVRELASLEVSVKLQLDRVAGDSARARNVVGVLEGADPKLKNQYVALVAHMDHTGITSGQPDSINNGADDNASGTAGLIALANAFMQPGIRPARSIIFLATSGGAKNFWGSNAFAKRLRSDALLQRELKGFASMGFVVVISDTTSATLDTNDVNPDTSGAAKHVKLFDTHVVTVVNLDRIGRARGDSVVIDGVGDARFAVQPTWAAAAHPELRLTVANGMTAAAPTSDQYAFVRIAVPSLYFHSTPDEDSSSAQPDSPALVDPDWIARVARLAFYVGYDIANALRAPEWTPEGRRAFLESAEW